MKKKSLYKPEASSLNFPDIRKKLTSFYSNFSAKFFASLQKNAKKTASKFTVFTRYWTSTYINKSYLLPRKMCLKLVFNYESKMYLTI